MWYLYAAVPHAPVCKGVSLCIKMCAHILNLACVWQCVFKIKTPEFLWGWMRGLKLPCPFRAFLPNQTLWTSEWERCNWHANSVLLSARYHGACHYNICAWNSWWLWFLSVWQSAWAPSSEWQGLAVNVNGREQLTEKRIIISLHYIYTACLSVSLPSAEPRSEQQSVLAMLYLPVLQRTNTFFGVNA